MPDDDGEAARPGCVAPHDGPRKVKRHLMQERFKSLIETMYDGSEERLIAAAALDR